MEGLFLSDIDLLQFRSILRNWYKQNCRILPWRGVKDPYLIWVSEVILQQTRVDQALDYYNRFIEKFPTVAALAVADDKSILKSWQGLGYYSRARNLHESAKTIMHDFKGCFPTTYEKVRSLKGVGDYTAAAICSFAYDLPCAVLDGNVFRFLARYFAIETPIDTLVGKREFATLTEYLLDTKYSALHNQAMMEMGALQCVAKNPLCKNCPFCDTCVAFQNSMVDVLPRKIKKNKSKNRFFYYFYVKYKGGLFLKKREKNDVWKSLYEFPLIETAKSFTISEVLSEELSRTMLGDNFILKHVSEELKHVLSHQNIYARCFYVEITEPTDFLVQRYEYVPFYEVENYPVSRLVERFLNEYLVK